MKRTAATIVALVLVLAMAMPTMAFASSANEPTIRVENNENFVPLRQIAYLFGAEAAWDSQNRTAILTSTDGNVHIVHVEAIGGFLEDGVAWVPLSFVETYLQHLLYVEVAEYVTEIEIITEVPEPAEIAEITEPVARLDLNLWNWENFENVGDARFSTDLPYGEIGVEYIRYMNDNLPARSAFTYRELETAIWIVEELLAMGHDWDNIEVQEFTYWEVNDAAIGLSGGLYWGMVTSPSILGEDREYQLREDRVSQNVVLTLPGQSCQTIVVGAHYDSPPYPSASDNASGTALLLESAQRMLELEHYHTIVYVFFGAEEVGLIGAYHYLDSLTQSQQDNIIMMVNADVLIEGPYILYGAGALPELTDAEFEAVADAVAEYLLEMMEAEFDAIMEMLDELGVTPAQAGLPFDSLESFLDLVGEQLGDLPATMVLMQGFALGLIEAEVDAISQQVSDIAAELSENNDFEFLSIVDAIGFPSDSLAFLIEGHRIVGFVGLERMDNITPELEAQLTRLGEGFGDLTVTILHSPLDDFDTIEAFWPGMMSANMEAFMLFLEAILTSVFS